MRDKNIGFILFKIVVFKVSFSELDDKNDQEGDGNNNQNGSDTEIVGVLLHGEGRDRVLELDFAIIRLFFERYQF